MKCMVLHEYGKPLREEERPVPEIDDNDILLKVDSCGICGTDLKIVTGKLPKIVSLPHVPGHEIAGTVADVGRKVSRVKQGDRGIAYFYLPCGDCEMCRTGHENICRTISRLGFEHDGGYAEYVKLPEYGFCPIPADEDPNEYAVLPDAVLTPYHSLVTLGGVTADMTVLVVGLGGLGLHAVQIAKLFGATVYGVDTRAESMARAENFGAELVLNGKKEDVRARVLEETGGKGVDLVFEGVGVADTFSNALHTLRRGGVLLLTGYDPLHSLPLDSLGMHYNEWKIFGTRLGTKEELLRLIDFVRTKRLRPVLSKTYHFTEANRALDELKSGKIAGRVVLTV